MSEITTEKRALFVVVNLSTGGDERLQKVYEWLDPRAVDVAKWLLGPYYQRFMKLDGENVTSDIFMMGLQQLADDPQIEAIDVLLCLHGSPGRLRFDDGFIRSKDLGDRLREAQLANKLRLLYSTACYGATHAPDLVRGGFKVASGALGICTNGMYDYPAQLDHWRDGHTYYGAVKAGNNKIGIALCDNVFRQLGLDDVNSKKEIFGKRYTRITSPAY
jgi:hypothetical protein